MPPVTLAAANPSTASVTTASRTEPATPELTDTLPGCALTPIAEPITPTRESVAGVPQLRLVPTGGRPGEVVHGHGGPSTCGCRECTMARHPASMPRLTVVR